MNSASVFQLWINAQTLIERFHSRPLRSKFIHNLEDKVQFCIVINAQRTIPIEFNAKRFMDIILYFYHSRMKKKTLSDTKYNYTTVIASCDKKKMIKICCCLFFFFVYLFIPRIERSVDGRYHRIILCG